jgi:hypothetical protein
MTIRISVVDYDPSPLSPSMERRLRSVVHGMLERDGVMGRSASGKSLAIAVEWCEERRRPYEITAHPGSGYMLRLLSVPE